jgi:hypothetical protein
MLWSLAQHLLLNGLSCPATNAWPPTSAHILFRRLDGPWPCQKVPLKATPLHITYYPESNLFAVLTSRQVRHWGGFGQASTGIKSVATPTYMLPSTRPRSGGVAWFISLCMHMRAHTIGCETQPSSAARAHTHTPSPNCAA